MRGIDSASLCNEAGRYGNPIPSRYLVPTDCSKFPAQLRSVSVTHDVLHDHIGQPIPVQGSSKEPSSPVHMPALVEKGKEKCLRGTSLNNIISVIIKSVQILYLITDNENIFTRDDFFLSVLCSLHLTHADADWCLVHINRH